MTAPGLRALLRVSAHDATEPVPDWRAAGRCVGWSNWPDDPWYPTEGITSTDLAKRGAAYAYGRAQCDRCPVRDTCREDALATESGDAEMRHGIRGGLDPRERANLARSRQRAVKREAATSASRAAIATAASIIAAKKRAGDQCARVARLTAQGQSLADIARALGISSRQVGRYRARGRQKATS